MDKLGSTFLLACQEAGVRQQEIVPALATTLAVKPEDVFYLWADRRCEQHGRFLGGRWRFFFHGMECDVKNQDDGRFLRIDFGPGGRFDTFTAWGIVQFIMASRPPWPAFEELKSFLAEAPPPYTEYSGSLAKAADLWDHLETAGLVELADKDLAARVRQYSSVNADGLAVLSLPAGFPPRLYHDLKVSSRHVISDAGRRILQLMKEGRHVGEALAGSVNR